jgi:hypothetical protein
MPRKLEDAPRGFAFVTTLIAAVAILWQPGQSETL